MGSTLILLLHTVFTSALLCLLLDKINVVDNYLIKLYFFFGRLELKIFVNCIYTYVEFLVHRKQ